MNGRLVVALGQGWEWGVMAKRYTVSLLWWKLIMLMIAQFWEFTKNHWIGPFEQVNALVCELYLSKVATKMNVWREFWKYCRSVYQHLQSLDPVSSPTFAHYCLHFDCLLVFLSEDLSVYVASIYCSQLGRGRCTHVKQLKDSEKNFILKCWMELYV